MRKFVLNVVVLNILLVLYSCNTSNGNKLEIASAEISLYNYELVDGKVETRGPFTFPENGHTTYEDFVLVGVKFHVGYYYDGTNDQPIHRGWDGPDDKIENVTSYWIDEVSGERTSFSNYYLTTPEESAHLYSDFEDFIKKYNSDKNLFHEIDLSEELFFFLSIYKLNPRCEGCSLSNKSTVIKMDFEFDNRSFTSTGKR